MKKIVVLLAVVLADIILLNSVSATDKVIFIPGQYFPILLLFLTMITTLFLFYGIHLEKAHQRWHDFSGKRLGGLGYGKGHRVKGIHTVMEKQGSSGPEELAQPLVQRSDGIVVDTQPSLSIDRPGMSNNLVKSYLLRKRETPALDLQYQFIDLIKDQIIVLEKEGKSEHEIIDILKEQRWDPQVIYLALGRTKQGEQTSS